MKIFNFIKNIKQNYFPKGYTDEEVSKLGNPKVTKKEMREREKWLKYIDTIKPWEIDIKTEKKIMEALLNRDGGNRKIKDFKIIYSEK